MANKPEEFPIFTPLDVEDVNELIDTAISKFLDNITQMLDIEDKSEIFIDQEIMSDIITRIEKRRVYFHIYHEVKMGELNEVALFVFWIIKLAPFKHSSISNSTLNTKIAYIFFVKTLYYVANETGKKVNVDKLLMNNLLYAFKYRDLSKEAIMALAESLLY